MGSGPVLGVKERKPRVRLPPLVSGRYLPLEELGSGGLGDVYLAHDIMGSRRVAIKVMKDNLVEKEKARGLMLNESSALNLLEHEGIPKLVEYHNGEQPYLVMDYVKGVPMGLKALSKRTRKEFVRLCADICGILEEIHRKGIVHRDLKPSNILINPETLKPAVLDFSHSIVPGMRDYSGTEAFGTPAFMSPEQTFAGIQADHRSDIYSLGVLMYMCLAGRTPFVMRDSAEEVMKQHRLVSPVPLELVDGAIPRGLSMVISIALNKMPQDRYPNVAELRKALEQLI